MKALPHRSPANRNHFLQHLSRVRARSHETQRPSGPSLLGSALPARTDMSDAPPRSRDVHRPPRTNSPPRRPSRRMLPRRTWTPRTRSRHAQPRLEPSTTTLPMHRIRHPPPLAECVPADARAQFPPRPHQCSGRCGRSYAPRLALMPGRSPCRTERHDLALATDSIDSSSHTDRAPTNSHDGIASCATARGTDSSGLGTRPDCTMTPMTGPMAFSPGPASHAGADTKSVQTLDAHGARTGEEPRSCLGITPEPPEHPCSDFPRRQTENQLGRRRTPQYGHRERGREAPLARHRPAVANERSAPAETSVILPSWEPRLSLAPTSAQLLLHPTPHQNPRITNPRPLPPLPSTKPHAAKSPATRKTTASTNCLIPPLLSKGCTRCSRCCSLSVRTSRVCSDSPSCDHTSRCACSASFDVGGRHGAD